MGDAQIHQRLLQPTDGVHPAHAHEQRVVGQIAGHVPLQRALREEGPLLGGVAGDVDIGIAAGAVGHIPAGQPAVFPAGLVRVVQPYLHALDQPVLVADGDQKPFRPGKLPLTVVGAEPRQPQQLMPAGSEQGGQQPPPRVRLRHTAVLVPLDALPGQSPLQQIVPVLVQQRQVIQHGGIGFVPPLQGQGPALRIFRGRFLPWHGIDLALPGQRMICLPVGHAHQPGVQRHAVAVGAAQGAAVLVCGGVQAEMVLSRPVVVAEGAGGLHLPAPQRPGIQGDAAPSGRVHNGDLIVLLHGQRLSPPTPPAVPPRRWAAPAAPPAARR